MSRRSLRIAVATFAFAAAAVCFVLGLAGRFSPFVASIAAALAFLTVGFYLAGPRGDAPRRPAKTG